jgi:hypothetical protein
MMLKDRPRSLSSGSADEASTPEARQLKKARVSDPTSPTVHVRAIYGRPQLSKTNTNNSYRWIESATCATGRTHWVTVRAARPASCRTIRSIRTSGASICESRTMPWAQEWERIGVLQV